MPHTVHFMPQNITIQVPEGTSLLQAQIQAGLRPDAPCGGKGTCGKCRVTLEGQEVLACQTAVDRDMTVYTEKQQPVQILSAGLTVPVTPEGIHPYVLAIDIGTTTVVAYLLSGITRELLSNVSCMNPQSQFGADVISRIQYAMQGGREEISRCIRQALASLTEQAAAQAGISSREITVAAIAGNTAMHHLLLGIDTASLVTPPYMPALREALELQDDALLPIGGKVRLLPNIAGFVGGDTVGCMLCAGFDRLEALTLMIDIGTNGEMVLGDKHRRITCSTAAGPAFEGAKISCGMRGAAGAVDHVWLDKGEVRWHVIGEGDAAGLCGSGLLDLVAVLLELDIIDESGRMEEKIYRLGGTAVTLTQKDVREVQLAKAAIRAGIELLAQTLGISISQIRQVSLAGAFGNYLSPSSACRIGMIPPELEDRIVPIGNAAGAGARMCALSGAEYLRSRQIAADTEFLELASLPQFQDSYVDALLFSEDEE